MNRFPQDNSILVMDNCSIHKSQVLKDIVESHGCRLYFLPPYSPDLNPIEESFSSLKAWIRRNVDRFRGVGDSVFLLDEACNVFHNKDARGWYKNSGYRVDL